MINAVPVTELGWQIAPRCSEDNIHKIALNTVKEFKAGRPVDLGAGNSGSIISRCAFVRQ